MDIGIGLPQGAATPHEVTTTAVAAERAGFSSLWAFDRLLAPVAPRTPYPASTDGALPAFMSTVLDPLLTLTSAAAVTSTIRLGTSVLVAPWYPPLLLARAAASLDHLSGGRFTLGLGVGWSVDEFEAVGESLAGRGNRLEEILDVLAAAWSQDVVEVSTRREQVARSVIGLKPTGGHVPVLLAAFTPAGMDRVSRRSDGWLPAGVPIEVLGHAWGAIRNGAEAHGRDPDSLRLVVLANIELVDGLHGPRPDFVGSVDQVRSDIGRCADLGAHEVIVNLTGQGVDIEQRLELTATLSAVGV